ncbi:E3 ubiquitin-protein ligase NEURL3-like isoform X2 [Sardina pilchardus]|uniref:E3 ubiquitin-protein ligase NEURL3-like isoform X2 n=1 Tax=Sardina pilchardus TaxID=27697 RepID=UPI002E0F1F42
MGNAAWAKDHHVCGLTCRGPLTFHPGAVGKKITLSHGNCRASRDLETFRDGLVFSSRPVKSREKVKFRVERSLLAWSGGVRIGFTNVHPAAGPLPPMTIPDLTNRLGYGVKQVPQSYCSPGSMITFWMDPTGKLCYKTSTGTFDCIQTNLNLSRPLWAIIDVYGQSTTVFLLGSIRRTSLIIQKSCPVPRGTFKCGYEDTPPELNKRIEMSQNKKKQYQEAQSNNGSSLTSGCRQEELCAVCLDHEADLTLLCGHRCLCMPCADRVLAEFGTCPLCRQNI